MVVLPLLPSLIVAAFGMGAAPVSSSAIEEVTSCEPTPAQDLVPEVVGPIAGTRPAWMVDGEDRWNHGAHPVKTLWVFSRTSQEIWIVGHRLDAPGALRLQRQPDAVTNVLVITDPGRTSVIPGGASSAVMRAYSFIPTYVFYPGPGCWEFTIRIGEEEVRIVREMKGRR